MDPGIHKHNDIKGNSTSGNVINGRGSGAKSRAKINTFDSMIEHQLKQSKKVNGSRKNQISINHLLDFQGGYVPEKQPKKVKKRKPSFNSNNKIHLYGIDFINLNYKFIVNCERDMKLQQLDPNVPIDNEDIIRVIAHKGNACPICLTDEIVAPRMITSCGHILCLKCLLNLLDSELPKAQKTQSSAILEKYKECPLCQSIIRKSEILPVFIDNIDERFEIPRVGDEINLTLMTRSSNRILPLPKSIQNSNPNFVDDFPWYNSEPNLSNYARIFRGDLSVITSLYNQEKSELSKQFDEEKVLYNEDSKFYDMTIKYIDDEITKWQGKFANAKPSNAKPRRSSNSSRRNSNDHDLHQVFHFYQTGFNTNCVYVLSPLDVKVLKTTYNTYENLPSSVVVKIENIKYEELSNENSITKYKYLSHLPLGTQLGFLECNWYQNGFIDPATWRTFENDLTKRSKYSSKKSRREEQDRKRAIIQDEIKTREFYANENADDYDDTDGYPTGRMGTLSIIDNRDLPSLTKDSLSSSDPTEPVGKFQTTIWGTQIPKENHEPSPSEEEENLEAEEMIRRAREEISKMAGVKGKKKKKKINLFST